MGVRLTPAVSVGFGFSITFCFEVQEFWLLSRRERLGVTACFDSAPAVVAFDEDAERLAVEAVGLTTEDLGATRVALLGAEMRAVEAVGKAPRLSGDARAVEVGAGVGLRASRTV